MQRRHPWVFDGAIAKGSGDAGETVKVESHDGRFLAWAAVSPSSKIRARVWSFDESQRIDAAFFSARIAAALKARSLFDIQSDGLRLVHGESDGLPGLVVDRYADTLVAQFSSCGVERWKSVIVQALLAQTGLSRLYERSDASVRGLEGLPDATGWLSGAPEGGSAGTEIVIREHDWQLSLNIAEGHKPSGVDHAVKRCHRGECGVHRNMVGHISQRILRNTGTIKPRMVAHDCRHPRTSRGQLLGNAGTQYAGGTNDHDVCPVQFTRHQIRSRSPSTDLHPHPRERRSQ